MDANYLGQFQVYFRRNCAFFVFFGGTKKFQHVCIILHVCPSETYGIRIGFIAKQYYTYVEFTYYNMYTLSLMYASNIHYL